MELYLDLYKGDDTPKTGRRMDRGKLVKKPVQVRGKDGKVFTRMQWVDPRDEVPHQTKRKIEHHVHLEAPTRPKNERSEFVDKYLKKMSKEAKQKMVKDYNLDYKHNDHPNILHKNMMVALKEHLYQNPHLIGGEHTSVDKTKTPDGTDKIQHWTTQWKKDPKGLYDLMAHLGISDGDPRNNPEWSKEGGDGSAPIRHMKNMMALKKMVQKDPSIMSKYSASGIDENPPEKTKESKKTVAEKGGNTIQGVLKNMSNDDKYKLVRKLGIDDGDPRNNPEWATGTGDGSAPIRHMKNMMALRKAIEKDPSILNMGTEVIKPKPKGSSPKTVAEPKSDKETVKNFLKDLSKDLKLQMAGDFEDHPLMKKRKRYEDDNIDYMFTMTTLRKIIESDPSIMDDYKEDKKIDEMKKIKVTNKKLEKFLRNVVGLKGIGDIAIAEKGEEWSFGVASFVRLEEDDEGVPVLSVVDAGKDGDKWDEHVYTLEDYKKFVDGVAKEKPKEQEIPLHKRPMDQIITELEKDMDKLTPEVKEVLGKEVYYGSIRDLGLTYADDMAEELGMSEESFRKLMDKLNIREITTTNVFGDTSTTIDVRSDNFYKFVFSHKVQDSKMGRATALVEKYGDDPVSWVLHESAKKWSTAERMEARNEFITDNLRIHSTVEQREEPEDRELLKNAFIGHFRKSLSFVPFDLFTDVFVHGGVHLAVGSDISSGSFFRKSDGKICLSQAYYSHKALSVSHPIMLDTTREFNFAMTAGHEFAHAVDWFLAGSERQKQSGSWNSQDSVRNKYTKGIKEAVAESYRDAITKHNKNKIVAFSSGTNKYPYHVDNFLNTYQGRIYDKRYGQEGDYLEYNKVTGEYQDKKFLDDTLSNIGTEHFAESVGAYCSARMGFEKEHSDKGYEHFGNYLRESHQSKGSWKDSNWKEGIPADHSTGGWAYYETMDRHPKMKKAIEHLFHRGDFLGQEL